MNPLHQAADLITAVVSTLDTSATQCEHCNRPTYTNWTEHQAAEELAAISRRIERWAARLSEAD